MKYILTGGPGFGKSSTLLALEMLGYDIVREAAEDVIKYNKANGIKAPWLETEKFQDDILELQLLRESKITGEITFIDRGSLDGIAYFEKEGLPLSEKVQGELERKKLNLEYDIVFLIESFGQCETNDVRREDLEEALYLEREIEKVYTNLGYKVVRIKERENIERAKKIERIIRGEESYIEEQNDVEENEYGSTPFMDWDNVPDSGDFDWSADPDDF